tara:strand:+ start:277 stop:519 length:243 start_codon:yes stop_codon:yes gene_type:complete
MSEISHNTYLKINKIKNRPNEYLVSAVKTNLNDDEQEFDDVAIITNWIENSTPSIRVPHYISNDILDQICKMVQTMEAPK